MVLQLFKSPIERKKTVDSETTGDKKNIDSETTGVKKNKNMDSGNTLAA